MASVVTGSERGISRCLRRVKDGLLVLLLSSASTALGAGEPQAVDRQPSGAQRDVPIAQGPPSSPSPNPSESIATLNAAMAAHYQAGEYEQAAQAARKLAAVLEREEGPDGENTLSVLSNLATLLSIQGAYDEADAIYERVLSARERLLPPGHIDLAGTYSNVAAHHRERGNYAKAKALNEKALAIREKVLGPAHELVALSINNLGAVHADQGNYRSATELWQRALAIREAALGPNALPVGHTLNNLAAMAENQGEFARAETLHLRSLKIREQHLGADHPQVAESHNNLGHLYDNMGRYQEAETHYQRSLNSLRVSLGDSHPRVADGVNNLATLYVTLGRHRAAEPLYEEAQRIRETALGPAHPATAQSLNNLGLLYDYQGRYERAEAYYLKAIERWTVAIGADHPDLGYPLNNLAQLYTFQRRFDEAKPLFERSLALREAALGPRHPDVATSLHNLAGFLEEQGRYEEAKALYERSLAVFEAAVGADHIRLANGLNNLAALHQTMGDLDKAAPLFRKALALREKALGPTHTDVAESLNNLALLLDASDRRDEALPMYERALQIVRSKLTPSHPFVGTVLNNLAALHDSRGEHDLAARAYADALEIREVALGESHRDVAVTRNNLAAMQLELDDVESALANIRLATKQLARESAVGTAGKRRRTTSQRAIAKSNRFAFARHVRVVHAVSEKLLAGGPRGSGSQRTRAGGAVTKRTDALLNESFLAGQQARGSGAARAVARMAARFAAGTDELARWVRERQVSIDKLEAIDKALVAAASRPAEKRSQADEENARRERSRLRDGVESIDRQLAKRYPRFVDATRPAPMSVAAVQALLAPDEAVLAWLVNERETFLWVVRADAAKLLELDVARADVDSMVSRLRRRLDVSGVDIAHPDDLPRFSLKLAHRAYRALFEAAVPELDGIQQLLLVPDGPLQSLPLSVLVTDKPANPRDYAGAAWLAKRWASSVLPAVSSLRALRELSAASKATRPFIGIGNPTFRGSGAAPPTTSMFRGSGADVSAVAALAPLPSSEVELRAIGTALGADSDAFLLGAGATESAVRRQDLKQARVIAFATHGLVAGELVGIAEPALALTPPAAPRSDDDGLLTASEIARYLDLDADWVVLSACNTAAGGKPGAEGLSGLAKAFFYAGSRSLLVSHWPVASEATTRLTTEAFRLQAATPALGRAEVFRQSMIAMMADEEHPHLAHPLFWAPFIVVGEGR